MASSPGALVPTATCLFTQDELPPDTRIEHTIPRALGGRIRSRIVSSNEFNNRCGAHVDPYLIRRYAEILCLLGPMMSAEHTPGNLSVEIPGSTGRFVLDPIGTITIQGIDVQARDPVTQRPTAVAGAELSAVRRWIRRNAPAGAHIRESSVPATTEAEFFTNRLVLGPVIEIAVLKSALLSFDHLLADDVARRFTRHASLRPIREFLRDAVTTLEYDGADLSRFSLGIQYDRLDVLERIRRRVPGARQAFEHTLIASGNAATSTLDCVFLVAGIDPYGFRLASDWDGGDFLCTVVTGILRNGEVSGPIWDSLPENICGPTNFRSFPGHEDEAVMARAVAAMSERWEDGLRRATDLVERSSRDMLIERITTTARLAVGGDQTIGTACRERLRRLYLRRREEDQAEFDRTLDESLASVAEILGTAVHEDRMPAIDWDRVVDAYYLTLDRVSSNWGLPGEVTESTHVIGTDDRGSGRLDDHTLSL